MNGVRLLQIIIILLVMGVIVYLLRLFHTLKLEKRLASFAISGSNVDEVSLFDKLIALFWKITKFWSKLLQKSVFFSKYGEKYNKFISFEKRRVREGIDYVSAKFLLAFLMLLFSLVTIAFHSNNFDLMFLLVVFIISFFSFDIFLNIEYARKRKRIEDDLLKAIIIMNNAFQSGRNIMQAIECVKLELEGPIQDEFKKIYLDMNYGLSLDVVFSRFYERVKLEDAKYITSSLTLLNKTGGDIVKVFSLIQRSIFDKKNLKNELKSLTAASQFVFKLLVVMPFVLGLVIWVLNPSYFKPFFTSALGLIIFSVIVFLYILYILVIRRALEVKL